MAAVYSTKLFSAPSASGPATLEYETPMTRLAVVRTITIVYGDISVSGLDAWVQTDDLCKLARYVWASTLSDVTNFGGTATFDLRHVLAPGEGLYVQTAAGTCDIRCSGYELTLP